MPHYTHTEEERRIRAAISTMPGGGAYEELHAAGGRVGREHGRPAPVTLAQVADYLEALRTIADRHATKAAEESAELRQLKRDIDAMRRVLFGSEAARHMDIGVEFRSGEATAPAEGR